MPDDRPIYYVYLLFDWCGIPRWIGKGKGNRINNHERSSSTNWLKDQFIEQTWIMLEEIPKIKIRENLTENEAFNIEIALIKAIGRSDLGAGPLTNMTDGGEGLSGRKMPQYQKQFLSEIRTQEWSNLSIIQRREATQHMRDAITPEEKSLYGHKGGTASASLMTPEQRLEMYYKGIGSLTPEQRSFLGKNYGYGGLTKEQRRNAGQKGQANRTFNQRSINMQKG